MTPEARARERIDARLMQSGWVVQDLRQVNPMASLGVAVREYPTSTGPVDYALFVEGRPVGVVEAKKDDLGENITAVESQSGRYAHSSFRYVTTDYRIRFAYEATGEITRFTDYADLKYRSRRVFSFHRPETLRALLAREDTVRNRMKHFPELDTTGFRKCQITAIRNLDASFADNRPKALVQMATGAGKTFTAITATYRLLKYGRMNRILFLVDTKSLGEQAEREFLAYMPNDDSRSFSQLYGVRRLKSAFIPGDVQICISTIQRMYSILRGEELDESLEEESLFEREVTPSVKEVVYNSKYPPEFFDCIIVDECHRSIYNVWNQVLEYFDAFLIGLTATPDKRTIAFFNENMVSEYSREQAIIDGVNVGEDIFLIETDSHADDIVQIVREEFGEGNEFCQKITCQADRPEAILSRFRNSYDPRIAVTVDMIATGTDVKAIECLIFMRDVRSNNYFEQMKGRGTRTLCKEDLQSVSPSATGNKDHFVIVDAVGVTRSRKTDTRPLERRPSVSLKALMMNVAMGAKDEDTLTSLANRIIRLNAQMSERERGEFAQSTGASAGAMAQQLLDAFDPDILAADAGLSLCGEPAADEQARMDEAKAARIRRAVAPFYCPEVRDYIEEMRRSHEQIIDTANPDTVTFAGFDAERQANADRVLADFRSFIEENRDELTALRIIYDQRYQDRPMAIARLKALYEKLVARHITVERLWECYAIRRPGKVHRGDRAILTDLISMVRFELGFADQLAPFADRVDSNFQRWTFRRNAGSLHFTEEQMEWLRLIKEHIAASLSVEQSDLDLSPFDHKGGLGRFYDLFGDGYEALLDELNRELVA